jgi:hypothetical protein
VKQDGHIPLPSQRTLFAIWDAIERVRKSQGEATAQQLTRAALAVTSEPGRREDSVHSASKEGAT